MATIGDLLLKVAGDWAEFQRQSEKEAVKAGDKAAVGWGNAFKKAGVMALAGGLSAAFAVMAKGAAEMERAQGDFVAATGRSREEAVKFADDMNSLVGRASTVGRSFEEISAAGIQVAQQFDLTGEAGTALTEDFLAFSKVTGQDAAGAVDDFDAALDAFGEPAERATSLMDQLVASNQEYGTVAGPEALSALANMAPALTAMNMGLDEGVGLLNLFESAGIDAGSTTAALNKAILSLEPGENLDDLIAELGAIEDPTLRAQRAMELFGARAGAKLALAIQPGMTSIDEFGISMEEAAGTTDEASEAMVTTTDKIRMAIEGLGRGLRSVGAEFGPVIMGLSSLSTLFGAALMKMLPAVTISGTLLGTGFAAAFKTAAILGILVGLAVIAALVQEKMMEIGHNLLGQASIGQSAMFEAQAAEVGKSLDEMGRLVQAEILATGADWQVAWATVYARLQVEHVEAADRVVDEASRASAGVITQSTAPIRQAAPAVHDAWEKGLVGPSLRALNGLTESAIAETARLAEALTDDLAGSLRDGTDTVKNAMQDLMWAIKHPLALTRELAKIEGALTSERLQEGLASEDEQLRRVSEHSQQILIDRYEELTGIAWDEGSSAADRLADGVSSEDGRLATSGSHSAQRWANAFEGYLHSNNPSNAVRDYLGPIHMSKPRPDAPQALKDLLTDGMHAAQRWTEGFRQGMGLTSGLAFATPSVAGFGDIGVNANSTLRVEHVLTREGAAALREEGFDEEGVAGFLRNLGREYGLPHQVTR